MMGIWTAKEVIRFTPVEDNFPTAMVNKVLDLNERGMFIDFLGLDFYDILVADLSDHAAATDFDNTVTYAVDQKVIYLDIVYISLENSNGDVPKNSSKWAEATKFDTEEYQNLWVDSLRIYGAFEIMNPSRILSTYKTDSGGSYEKFNEDAGRRTASGHAMKMIHQTNGTLQNRAKELLIRFICKALEDSDRKAYYEKVGFITGEEARQIEGARLQSQRRSIAYRNRRRWG